MDESQQQETVEQLRPTRAWAVRIPNWLTLIRIVLIPVFVALLIDPTPTSRYWATVIFVVAAITDYLDGVIARRLRAESELGKLLDPLADKILVAAALIMLVGMEDDRYGEPFIPAWLVVIIIAREFWVTGLRGVAAIRGTVVAAGGAGKVKSFLQMVAIVFLLMHDPMVTIWGYVVPYYLVGLNLIVLSVIFSIMGAYQYSVTVLTGGETDVPFSQVARLIGKRLWLPRARDLDPSQ